MEQWYDKNPQLLELGKKSMKVGYPDFSLQKLEDGRLYWVGSIQTGIEGTYPNKTTEYCFMMVYSPFYPNHYAGCPLRTYLIEPEIKDIICDLGFFPCEFRIDSSGEKYIDFCDYTDAKSSSCIRAVHQAYLMSVEMLALEIYKSGQISRESILQKRHFGLNGIDIPHWHIKNQILLEQEKTAMSIEFPDFKCSTMKDGRLFWSGNFYLSQIDIEIPITLEYDKHHPNYNYRKTISIYLQDSDHCITNFGFHKLSFEPNDNPMGISAQLCWDKKGRIRISLWKKSDLNNPTLHNAAYELRLLKVWCVLFQKIAILHKRFNSAIRWADIEKDTPNIKSQIEEILYGKI